MSIIKEVLGLDSSNAQKQQIMPVMGCLLLALGVLFPVVKTTTGYSYSIVGTEATLCYVVAAFSLVVHLFYRQMSSSIAISLLRLSSWLFVAVLIYGLYVASTGWDWFYYQTAVDMPGFDSVNKDEYWQLLYSYTGHTNTAFGDLRKLYETWGAGVTLNDQPIFTNIINGLPIEAVKKLSSLKGASFFIFPYGLVMLAAGLSIQFRSSLSRIRELKELGSVGTGCASIVAQQK